MKDTIPMQIKISQIDFDRFKVKTAKTYIHELAEIDLALEEAKENGVKLIVARSYVVDISLAQRMEAEGFFLTDTLVYYNYDLIKRPIPEDSNQNQLRPVRAEEAAKVKIVAEKTFKGYFGHYHADPHLNKIDCDDVYSDWAYRSCIERTKNTEVYVAIVDREIAGFATMRLNNEREGEGVLFGVAPEMQGRGLYKSFIIKGLQWCKDKGCSSMVVSTQINNIAVQKVWTRTGFEMTGGYYTYHKWLS
jgi:GNAT superfamily N-acetyltransferase